MKMRSIARFAFVVLMGIALVHPGTVAPASASSRRSTTDAEAHGARVVAGAVKVTVTYKGKGAVDGSHRVWLWLFTSPDIGPNAMPIAEASVEKNGGTVTFEGVAAERVWIAAAYDERGVMMGNAPPAAGSPVGVYVGSDGAPRSVVPGDSTVAVMTFDDSFRMP
jgi:hypothetical protein